MDSVSWVAFGAALTVAGLLAAVLVAKRRGPGPGLRTAGWALLPLAAGLTGLLRLAGDIVDSVGRWAVRLVFSPTVWLGVVVAGAGALLWLAGTAISARSRRKGVGSGPAPTLPSGSTPSGPPAARGRGKQPALDEDQDDIEAILRKHGIS
jgi:hypothetical protein